jgi:hypothetical protein
MDSRLTGVRASLKAPAPVGHAWAVRRRRSRSPRDRLPELDGPAVSVDDGDAEHIALACGLGSRCSAVGRGIGRR